jgi:hypothetical protein
MNEKFKGAKKTYDRMIEESLAKYDPDGTSSTEAILLSDDVPDPMPLQPPSLSTRLCSQVTSSKCKLKPLQRHGRRTKDTTHPVRILTRHTGDTTTTSSTTDNSMPTNNLGLRRIRTLPIMLNSSSPSLMDRFSLSMRAS